MKRCGPTNGIYFQSFSDPLLELERSLMAFIVSPVGETLGHHHLFTTSVYLISTTGVGNKKSLTLRNPAGQYIEINK